MKLSPDSLAILLLTSQLGLDDDSVKPLTLREWNPLARMLQAASLRPSDLFAISPPFSGGVSTGDAPLELSSEVRAHLTTLLERREKLEHQLDRLAAVGIYPLTRADSDYPQRYRQRLKESAPTVLFYSGEKALLGQPGIAVVGSRHLDEAGQECARFIGNACGFSGLILYSGGAKGVDSISMKASLDARGTAVGILAHSLEKEIRKPENRAALQRGDLCLVTPYSPGAGFSVGSAMGRNRLIYALADYAIVVASDLGKGGTWTGATEALKAEWIPVFVLQHEAMPDGNKQLINKGALAFPHPFPSHFSNLATWLKDKAAQTPPKPSQGQMF